MNTFEDYLKEPYALGFDQMQSLHHDLLAEIDKDPEAIELYEELLDECIKYASVRAKWSTLSIEEKREKDASRTSKHNSVITHFNILARYLKMQGKSADWREELGNEEDNRYFRKTIGDLGCYIAFVNSLCSR